MASIDGLLPLQWSDLSAQHIGRTVHIQWPAAARFSIGVIDGIGSDRVAIRIYLGYGADYSGDDANGPRLYLLPEKAPASPEQAPAAEPRKSAWTINGEPA